MRLEDSSPAFASAAVTYIHYFILDKNIVYFLYVVVELLSISVIFPLICTWQLKHWYMMRKQEN